MFKKLNALLAVLLCCVFAVASPYPSQAAPSAGAAQQESIDLATEHPLILFAGEASSGDPEAVLLLDRALLTPVLLGLLQHLYPQVHRAAPAPHPSPASNRDCGLHTILTKGP